VAPLRMLTMLEFGGGPGTRPRLLVVESGTVPRPEDCAVRARGHRLWHWDVGDEDAPLFRARLTSGNAKSRPRVPYRSLSVRFAQHWVGDASYCGPPSEGLALGMSHWALLLLTGIINSEVRSDNIELPRGSKNQPNQISRDSINIWTSARMYPSLLPSLIFSVGASWSYQHLY